MFAVPGWSVSASSLKRQTEADIVRAETQEGKPSKKRKRKSGANTDVTNENVSNLWAQKFEGKRPMVAAKPPVVPVTETKPEHTGDNGIVKAGGGKGQSEHKHDKPKDKQHKHDKDHDKASFKKEKRPQDATPKTSAVAPKAPPPAPPSLPPAVKLTPMQQKMREKLVSARFRHLNETLYTAPSNTSLAMFDENPTMFEDYHSGFRRQVSVWPENPVDTFTRTFEARAKVRAQFRKGKGVSEVNGGEAVLDALPRTKDGICTIADLGCGDGSLGRKLTASGVARKKNLKLLSFDLAAPNEHIIKADVANLPLADGSVDVAVFCLALMGTNWIDFIEEAYRVLRWKGELWVAEIKSRFARKGEKKGGVVDHSVGKRRKIVEKKSKADEEGEEAALRTEVDGEEKREETQVEAFVQVLARRGFVLRKGEQSVDLGNKMFVRMEFIKAAPAMTGKNAKPDAAPKTSGKKFVETKREEVSREEEGAVLKPCLYKVR